MSSQAEPGNQNVGRDNQPHAERDGYPTTDVDLLTYQSKCLLNTAAVAYSLLTIAVVADLPAVADESKPLPFGANAGRWNASGDLSEQMVAGIHRVLDRMTANSVVDRQKLWKRDFASPQAYTQSIASNRQRLRAILGAVDLLSKPVQMRYVSGPDVSVIVAESETVRVQEVQWTVFEGVHGAGLLLTPKRTAIGRLIVLPDADQSPELLSGLHPVSNKSEQVAQRLAEAGFEVLVPSLIDRQSTWSGNPAVTMTDETHREWIWRPAFEVGRNLIGFEVRKVEAAVEWFQSLAGPPLPIGILGYGEGGCIALCTAALDQRIKATVVSGYFQPREKLASEPIYRSVWGLLREFGDAEIASLIAPRGLMIECSEGPRAGDAPVAASTRRKSAAPGTIAPPALEAVQSEVDRARTLCTAPDGKAIGSIQFVSAAGGQTTSFGSIAACEKFTAALGVSAHHTTETLHKFAIIRSVDARERQHRQVSELIEHCQRLLRRSKTTRAAFAARAAPTTVEIWETESKRLREQLWNEVIGRLPDPSLPMNPRVRCLEERTGYTMWEVMLDVWPDVFTWGYLIVPNDLKAGERRPVVVCQHGLEGLPASVVEENHETRDWKAYRAFARQLAERGFICYCPHNPYRGGTAFRQLQRKANPLGLTLFSFILGQHQRQLEWLASLPFVDSRRIGFYGLSYGGVSALRLPALLDGYCLSICSAAFNDWARKIMSTEFPAAYVFTAEYDHFSFNLASTFNNAELAFLIAPRPFMVERGHQDAVAPTNGLLTSMPKCAACTPH